MIRRFLHNPLGVAGAVLVLVVVLLSLAAPLLPLPDPNETRLTSRLLTPGSDGHLLGTDLLGRDILSRLIWGTRISLAVAVAATLIAAFFGSSIGLVAGYFGRHWDSFLMRGIDMVMAFPYLLLALAIVAVLGPGLLNALVAIAIVNIPFFARTVRGATMGLVKRDFVDTARMSGRSELAILLREILPNVLPVIIITMATTLGWMILETAGLSFLGLGAQPPQADLGSMLGEGRKLLLITPHLALLPGLVVFVLVVGINLAGDGLRDVLDPRMTPGMSGAPCAATRVDHSKPVPVSDEPSALLEVCDLLIEFQFPDRRVQAVKSLSFTLQRAGTLGLVGESGSGKSVTALSLMRLLPSPPAVITSGSVQFDGHDLLQASPRQLRRLRGNRVGYIFQDPLTSLNPMFPVGDQVAESIRLHRGCSHREAWKESVELLDTLRIPHAAQRARSYPHELSGGMRQRVVIAMALANQPDLLIADEPTTALDVTVQRAVMDLLQDRIKTSQTALLFISHDLALVSEICENVMVMRHGEIVESGRTCDVLNHPNHDYTKNLLACLPSPDRAPVAKVDSPELFQMKGVIRQFRPLRGGWFAPATAPFLALKSVGLTIPKGSAFGIVGESGSGKSTLARILCGLLEPSEGQVSYLNRTLGDWMRDPRAYRSQVQIVFQDPASSLNPRMTIRSILQEPLRLLANQTNPKEQEARMQELLEQTGLPNDALDRHPHEFSGGQAQRIGIARALAASPKVLVLDEAVSALDVSIQAQILELLRKLREDHAITLVFISHDLSVVRELCTHVAVLRHGEVVEYGHAEKIFLHPQTAYTKELLTAAPRLKRSDKVNETNKA